MSPVQAFVRSPFAEALGRTLAHSLWQGALAALVVAFVLAITRRAQTRYNAACVALLGIVAAFGVTFVRFSQAAQAIGAGAGLELARRVSGNGPLSDIPFQLRAADLLPWLAPVWLLGVLLFQIRTMNSVIGVHRLRTRGVCSAPGPWHETLGQLRRKLAISRPVLLLESALAEVPAVAGWLQPVILVPVGMFSAMSPGQLEAILLHELAHIRRHDYLANLVQTAIEGLLFYHPAVWWISHVIRSERENCCDDLVVSTRGEVLEYAGALAALEHARIHSPALAATGGHLMKRIQRLLAPNTAPTALSPVVPAAVLALTGALVLTAFQSTRPQTPYQAWLEQDAAYIITDTERARFNATATAADREAFIADFWLTRDPTPGTPENEYKVEHYRRIKVADERFSTSVTQGWRTDRGRIYITYGPPDEMEAHPAAAGKPASQQWLYRYIKGIGNNVIIEFIDAAGTGEFRMTTDPNNKR